MLFAQKWEGAKRQTHLSRCVCLGYISLTRYLECRLTGWKGAPCFFFGVTPKVVVFLSVPLAPPQMRFVRKDTQVRVGLHSGRLTWSTLSHRSSREGIISFSMPSESACRVPSLNMPGIVETFITETSYRKLLQESPCPYLDVRF